MNRASIASVALACAVVAPWAGAAGFQDFAGTWIVRSSTAAPWKESDNPVGATEDKRIVGRSVTFAASAVTGPSPIGCAKPVYKVDTVGPDMIFEGQLAEAGGGAKAPDAAASAAKLGFAEPQRIETLDAGCTEVQFHLVKPGTLAFGLNNRVYVMTRKSFTVP
ncbi:MAG TPA: hypothetical protein VMN56_00600 [Casimicrobiaceae bacterium]|nr:hypothetical protein [Casimicrobiaceae bacterium]